MNLEELLKAVKEKISSRPTQEQRIAALEAAVTELAVRQAKERESNA